MSSDKGFMLDPIRTTPGRYILSLRVTADRQFRRALRRLPAVAMIVTGRFSTIVLEISRVFTEAELRMALIPLVEALAVRRATARPYTPHYFPEDRGHGLVIYWFQRPADEALIAALEADPGIKSVTNCPKDRNLTVTRHLGFSQAEVEARITLYCNQFLARQS